MNKRREILYRVVRTTFGIDRVESTLSQERCGCWDSLNHLNLVIALEEAFGVSFEPEEMARMRSLDEIEALLDEKTAGGQDEKTAGGQDEKTAGGQDEKTAGGQDEKTAGGQDEKTAGGQDEGVKVP